MDLTTKFSPYTDEQFKAESKLAILTNTDYDWTGAHTVKIWKMSTAGLNDYKRNFREEGTEELTAIASRFGSIVDITGQTEEMTLKKDRSFIFSIDKLTEDETAEQASAGKALSRELREVVIPEVDSYTYNVMVTGAGTTAAAETITKENVYQLILAGSEALDNAEVPDTERVLVLTPSVYTKLKQAAVFDNTEVGAEMKARGVIGWLDGMQVVKVPASRLPKNFGFMIAHPSATVAPTKLEDYKTHTDTILSSGSIVTGRIVYDAFVLENKKKGIYHQPVQ